jgi:hypothetical protein
MKRTAVPRRSHPLSVAWLPAITLAVGIPTMIFGSLLIGSVLTLLGLVILGAFAPRRQDSSAHR